MRRPADKLCSYAHVDDSSDEVLLREMGKRLERVRAFSTFEHLREVDRDAYRAIEMMAREVIRQRDDEKWSVAHDDEHTKGEMAAAASCYAANACLHSCSPDTAFKPGDMPPAAWMWDRKWWKPRGWNRDLIRAGALLAVEWGRKSRELLTKTTHFAEDITRPSQETAK